MKFIVTPWIMALFALVSFTSLAPGETITLRDGDVRIQVPVPEGTASVSDLHPEFQALKLGVGGGNEVLALMLPPEDADSEAEPGLCYDVQLVRKNRGCNATKSDLTTGRKEFDEKMNEMTQALERKTGLSGFHFMPIHEVNERYFSFAVRMPTGPVTQGCCVATTALVRGRVWLFYVRDNHSSSPEALMRVKEAAKNWILAILAASPSDEATLERENSVRGLFGFDWNRIMMAGVTGGIMGAILHLFKKKKRR